MFVRWAARFLVRTYIVRPIPQWLIVSDTASNPTNVLTTDRPILHQISCRHILHIFAIQFGVLCSLSAISMLSLLGQ